MGRKARLKRQRKEEPSRHKEPLKNQNLIGS